MFLKNISIVQFKSHQSTQIQMGKGITCITGKNGVGKTNILDAIYCLLNGKSYFHKTDLLCIMQNESYYVLKGELNESAENEIRLMVSFQLGKRKVIKIDDKPLEKLARYFGKYPCVVIAPNDDELVLGESEHRRRFFDYMLSMVDEDYLKHLIHYNKALELRNKQLKIFQENNCFDQDLLDFYNAKLESHGFYIYTIRQKATSAFVEFFDKAYSKLANGLESPLFIFKSQLNDLKFIDGFSQSLDKDKILARTNFGIHRDDWLFELKGMPLKKTGSQGQIKSFIISMKLAMYNFIYEKKGVKSLLLLDDIFEKIDAERMGQLINIITQPPIGQVLITGTNKQQTLDYFKEDFDVTYTELEG